MKPLSGVCGLAGRQLSILDCQQLPTEFRLKVGPDGQGWQWSGPPWFSERMGSKGQRERAKAFISNPQVKSLGLLEPMSLALLCLIPPIIQQRKTEQVAGFISTANLAWKGDLCCLLCHQSLYKASLSLDILSLDYFRKLQGRDWMLPWGVWVLYFDGCLLPLLLKHQIWLCY